MRTQDLDSLRTRAQRRLAARPLDVEVLVPRGEDATVRQEIETRLDGRVKITPSDRGWTFELANLSDLMRLAFLLSTARDILWILDHKRLESLAVLRDRLTKIPWTDILPAGAACLIRVSMRQSRLVRSGPRVFETASAILKAAGYRVIDDSSEYDAGDCQVVDLRIDNNHFRLGLSACGLPLYRRGYKRLLRSRASIREDLAACVLRRGMLWLHEQGLDLEGSDGVVAFAGSGTLGFEWEGLTLGLTAPLWRRFALEQWVCVSAPQVSYLRRELLAQGKKRIGGSLRRMWFEDLDANQREGLAANIDGFYQPFALTRGQVTSRTAVLSVDSWTAPLPARGSMVVLANPPYDQRLGVRKGGGGSIVVRYSDLARRLMSQPEAGRRNGLGVILLCPTDAVVAAVLARWQSADGGFRTIQWPVRHGGRSVVALVAYRGHS